MTDYQRIVNSNVQQKAMQFLIADTFTESLSRLNNTEQQRVKTSAFDLQLDPSRPGLNFERLRRPQDPDFRSVRVSRDVRIIIHQSDDKLLLCYVGHHDVAYRWAERRRLEIHPMTGAAQLVEVRETVREVPVYVEVERPKPPLYRRVSDDDLLRYGVPEDWLEDVRGVVSEDDLLELATHLPEEASEALLQLATGGSPSVPPVPHADPFSHSDALRRFRAIGDTEELARALDYPWEKWAVFLHPTQRALVERNYRGPARVSGSAGTGKTVVALHRAVHLARSNPESRVLLTTFSDTLANSLRAKLRVLIDGEPLIAERLEIHAIETIGRRLYERRLGNLKIAPARTIRKLLETELTNADGVNFSEQFLMSEWELVVDAWQLDNWEAYRDVQRLGRRTRLPESRRRELWKLFERVQSAMNADGQMTLPGMFTALAAQISSSGNPPFDMAVVDEAQDLDISHLKFLAAMCGAVPNGLFFTGDLGQRIFQQPFSWKSLGVDIRGRSHTMKVNYRTSHQIRKQADLLLDPDLSDVDGNIEERGGTISLFNGADPQVKILASGNAEIEAVGEWLSELARGDVKPHEMAVFVRSEDEIGRAKEAVKAASLPYIVLDNNVQIVEGHVSISTMHLAKGLEFHAVAAIACDSEVIPSSNRLEVIADGSDLEDAYNTERYLLYVACTRARDYLLVTGVVPESEFLSDLQV